MKMSGTEEWPLAEIISIKEIIGMNYYYVHYVDCKFYPVTLWIMLLMNVVLYFS